MATTIGNVSDFGGRVIHWQLRSGTGPTVVMINGCGLAAEHWGEVLELMPGRRVVRFDRPGMGGTTWPRRMPKLSAEVASLKDLIEATGHPAFLVAHSMASFHAEALARTYPELVAGIVMVDGSVEFLAEKPRRFSTRLPRVVHRITRIPPFHLLGSLTHRAEATLQSQRRGLGHQWESRFGDLYTDPESAAMGVAEAVAYWPQAWDLLELRMRFTWPGTPTVLLTAADQRLEKDWYARQRRLADLLGAQHVMVDGSDHLMMFDCPQAIVSAIDAVQAMVERPAAR